ncbi:MAG TPA: hypothetical protein PLX89_14635 [Verrucomicrobiota bacterium]|nr:hypothetical protein [Verrucomicrobiales bacterium]HRI14229.1 hypothetical protein [Verrucomicrobiota bacterium]
MNPGVILASVLFSQFFTQSLIATDWEWRHPTPQGDNLTSVAFGNNTYVATASRGHILVSTDGRTWDFIFTGRTNNLASVAFANGRFVAVGDAGRITSSADGRIWGDHLSPTDSALRGVAYGNSMYVAVGRDGKILASTDLVDWTTHDLGPSLYFFDVAFGNGAFLALDGNGQIRRSPDGLDWSQQSAVEPYPRRVAFVNGRFLIADGYVSSSSDGLTWDRVWVNPGPRAVAYGNGVYIGVGYGGRVFQSANGQDWHGVADVPLSGDLNSVIYSGTQFVAIGDTGSIITSADGNHWIAQDRSVTYRGDLFVVAADQDRVFAGGDFGIGPGGVAETSPLLTSTDGKTWQRAAFPGFSTIHGIALGGGRVVAIDGYAAWLSVDGSAFSRLPESFGGMANSVLYSRGRFHIVGPKDKLWWSEDGTNWNTQSFSVSSITGIARMIDANGLFVAAAYSVANEYSYMLTSSDGAQWTRRQVRRMRAVTGGNGRFVAVGDNGRTAYSDDGQAWTQPEPISSEILIDVCHDGSKFYAVTIGGAILASPDGVQWSEEISPTKAGLSSIRPFRGTMIAVGSRGAIVQRGSVAVPRLEISVGSPGATLKLTGVTQGTFLIESRLGLEQPWIPLDTLEAGVGVRELIDPNVATPKKLYRAVQQ